MNDLKNRCCSRLMQYKGHIVTLGPKTGAVWLRVLCVHQLQRQILAAVLAAGQQQTEKSFKLSRAANQKLKLNLTFFQIFLESSNCQLYWNRDLDINGTNLLDFKVLISLSGLCNGSVWQVKAG